MMSLYLTIGLIGIAYMVVFSVLSITRREGLSLRFVGESALVTAMAMLLILVAAIQIHPVIFLLLLYLITMRVRMLVDLANAFAGRSSYPQAEKLYGLASAMWPDQANALVIKVNRAIMLLHKNQLDDSIALFTDILSQVNTGYLGVKYLAAAHYNLGVAYLRKENLARAADEFKAVLDCWPDSVYAQRAQNALERQSNKNSAEVEVNPPGE